MNVNFCKICKKCFIKGVINPSSFTIYYTDYGLCSREKCPYELEFAINECRQEKKEIGVMQQLQYEYFDNEKKWVYLTIVLNDIKVKHNQKFLSMLNGIFGYYSIDESLGTRYYNDCLLKLNIDITEE